MSFLTIVFMAATLSVVVTPPGYAAEPAMIDSSGTTAAAELVVKGDVLTIEGEIYTVKDTTGHQVRLHVNNESKLESRFKVGDKIEAHVTSEGHATSIALQVPQHSTTTVLPNTGPTVLQPSPGGSAY